MSILEPLGRELPPGSRRTQTRPGGVHRPPPLRQARRLRPARQTRGRGSRRVRSTRGPRWAPQASRSRLAPLRGGPGPQRLSPRSPSPPQGRGGAPRLPRRDPRLNPPLLPRVPPDLPLKGHGQRLRHGPALGGRREEGTRGRGRSRNFPSRGTPPEVHGGLLGLPPLPTSNPRRGQRRSLEERRSPPPLLGRAGYGGTCRGAPMGRTTEGHRTRWEEGTRLPARAPHPRQARRRTDAGLNGFWGPGLSPLRLPPRSLAPDGSLAPCGGSSARGTTPSTS